jgi:N-acetylmuramoyl-L-alanine amidase
MPHLPREHSRFASSTALGRILVFLAVSTGLVAAESDPQHHVTAVRFWSLGDVTRVAIETDGDFETLSDHLSDPERIFFDLAGTTPALGSKNLTVIPVGDKLIQQIRVAEPRKNVTRVVLDLVGVADVRTSRLENPNRLIIEVWQPGHAGKAAVAQTAAAPTTAPQSEPREHRPFLPPLAKPAAPPKRAQVALMEPPLVSTTPPGSAALNAKLTSTYQNTSAPPPERTIDLRHLPDPNAPEIGPHAYPTPSASASKRSTDSSKADGSEFAAKRVASLASAPETTLVANPGTDTFSTDKATTAKRTTTATGDTALPAKRNSTGDRSMIRVLGLKVGRIVLDPGHGGHDTGTIGPEGLREKDLVLDVAKRLGALIEDRMGSEVVYTRSDDTFVPLERRTEIANEAKADLFLSIHANSSTVRTAAGVETYYLSFTTSKTALELAARENAGSQETVYDLQDILQKIALSDKVDESRDFAARVQTSLFALAAKSNAHSKDRGIRKAPFIVLIGANMPSVLAEVGFISNAHDESTMKRQDYRERIAEALYKGVSGYASTLSHFQVAQHHSSSSP